MKLVFYIIFIACALLLHITAGNRHKWGNCGKLKISQVYNESRHTEADEFPWFGRVFYRGINNFEFRCLSILLSKRHLISPAHCYISPDEEAVFVSLGDSGKSERNYTIADIAIQPNYNFLERSHDIAVIQLIENVEFSDFIQPICLPPASIYTDELLGQFLTYGGYSSNERTKKTKSVAHVKHPKHCGEALGIVIPNEYICATSNTQFLSLAGSALMGVTVEDSEVQSYYLIAFVTAGQSVGGTTVQILVKVPWHINWIRSNIVATRGEKYEEAKIYWT